MINKKQMTKEEILKIIDQNRDVLTPENYLGILKNVDIFTEEEKQAIVSYLKTAHEMIQVNHRFVAKQNALYQKTADRLEVIDRQMSEGVKRNLKDAEKLDLDQSSSEAQGLISGL